MKQKCVIWNRFPRFSHILCLQCNEKAAVFCMPHSHAHTHTRAHTHTHTHTHRVMQDIMGLLKPLGRGLSTLAPAFVEILSTG